MIVLSENTVYGIRADCGSSTEDCSVAQTFGNVFTMVMLMFLLFEHQLHILEVSSVLLSIPRAEEPAAPAEAVVQAVAVGAVLEDVPSGSSSGY